MILGELSLDGTVRGINGVLCHAIAARENGIEAIILPEENAPEAAVVQGLKVYPIKTLTDAVAIITEKEKFVPLENNEPYIPAENLEFTLDFEDVKGQQIFCT
jgi:magnesium chelatase family protein